MGLVATKSHHHRHPTEPNRQHATEDLEGSPVTSGAESFVLVTGLVSERAVDTMALNIHRLVLISK